MGIMSRIQRKMSERYVIKEAVRVLGISESEAKKRVANVIKHIPFPEDRSDPKWQMAVDIFMQVPSDEIDEFIKKHSI